MKITYYLLSFNILIFSIPTYTALDYYKNQLSYINRKKLFLGGSVLTLFMLHFFLNSQTKPAKNKQNKENKEKNNSELVLGNTCGENNKILSQLLVAFLISNQICIDNLLEDALKEFTLNEALDEIKINNNQNNPLESHEKFNINYTFPEKEALDLQQQYLYESLDLINKIKYFLTTNQNQTKEQNINKTEMFREFNAHGLQKRLLISFNTFSGKQKNIFNIVFEEVRKEIGDKLKANQDISRIFQYEIEIFDKYLKEHNLSEKDQKILSDFLVELQCIVYKNIFGKREFMDLYAPKKIHEEQMDFLNALLNTVQTGIGLKKQKFYLLQQIYNQILNNLGNKKITDFFEEAKNVFTALCNAKEYDEALKNAVLEELEHYLSKNNLNDISLEEQKKYIHEQLESINSLIDYLPQLDNDYIGLIQSCQNLFEKEINSNVVLLLQKEIQNHFIKVYIPKLTNQKNYSAILNAYGKIQKDIITTTLGNAIFLEFYTMSDCYQVKYSDQLRYLRKSKEILKSLYDIGEIFHNPILKVKENLVIAVNKSKNGIKGFLKREFNDLKGSIKKCDVSYDQKDSCLKSFREDSIGAYEAIKIKNQKEKQSIYLKNTINNLQMNQQAAVKHYEFLLTIKLILIKKFYSLKESEIENILNTEQEMVRKQFGQNTEFMHGFIQNQNSVLSQMNNHNIPVPDINKKLMHQKN